MSSKHWARALITGASSGIGQAFARQLAHSSDALTLVARRGNRLRELARELSAQCAVDVLTEDLLQTEGVAAVVEHVRQCGPIDLLVNNAGFSTLGPFAGSELDAELAMVRLHEEATLTLTRAVLPAMCSLQRGAIINVSSVVAFQSVPKVATYAGSKAFLANFSRALHAECADSGVIVQCLCPGYTRTEMHSRESFSGFDVDRIPEELWMTPEAVVIESLSALAKDNERRNWLLVPGAHNRALVRSALRSLADSLGDD